MDETTMKAIREVMSEAVDEQVERARWATLLHIFTVYLVLAALTVIYMVDMSPVEQTNYTWLAVVLAVFTHVIIHLKVRK